MKRGEQLGVLLDTKNATT